MSLYRRTNRALYIIIIPARRDSFVEKVFELESSVDFLSYSKIHARIGYAVSRYRYNTKTLLRVLTESSQVVALYATVYLHYKARYTLWYGIASTTILCRSLGELCAAK